MNRDDLAEQIPHAALAFRGYNVTNLGRSRELLLHGLYGPIVAKHLRDLSPVTSEMLNREVDLVRFVREGKERSLETYGETLSLIVAMEMAQLELLKTHFDIDYSGAKLSFGYSLGEITALVAGRIMEAAEAIKIPLMLCEDCVALARDVTLGILFTRSGELPQDEIRRLCLRINGEGKGVIGISSYLSPNSILVMGQLDTLDRFKQLAVEQLSVKVSLRKNNDAWPPLHTPIVWDKHIPNRAAWRMHTLAIRLVEPKPTVLSLVTGRLSYTELSARSLIHQWVDHPQRLWEAVCEVLARDVKTIIHIGPEPNLILATFKRLSENISAQTEKSLSMRALSAAARRPWLQGVLPERASLMRAPFVQHVILEDWLLENAPV
ncbi:MAG: ACP S-malonyltransferase [Pirellulaceae bacterium]|nr:ACP S-malonyltransferase [Pirellulaceae bacterium]